MRIEEIHESAVDDDMVRLGTIGGSSLWTKDQETAFDVMHSFQHPSSDTSAAADASAESGRMEVPHG